MSALEGKYNVLLVSSQPTQADSPLKLMATNHPHLEVLTAYCSLDDERLWRDPEHLNKEAFDTPALEGYAWTAPANYSPSPQLGKFYGLINPGLVSLVLKADCCVVYGHSYVSFWLAIVSAKLAGKPLLLTTDATQLAPAEGSAWKTRLKRRVLPLLYNRVADGVLVPSTAARRFICSLGVCSERVYVTPYVVENERIERRASETDRKRVRAEWGVPEDARLVAFCAKFLPRKRPHDALRAFAEAGVPKSYLIMVGDGPLRGELSDEAQVLGIADRVRFLGLVKYSRLPEIYATCELLIFTSEHEPYGLPVNEAMICGTPVIASDRVGAGCDLIREGETGFTFPCGDTARLAALLRELLPDGERLRRMGEAARRHMQSWSPRENAEATAQAIERAIISKQTKSRAGLLVRTKS